MEQEQIAGAGESVASESVASESAADVSAVAAGSEATAASAAPIKIADVESESIVDGPGFRFAVYTQGCPHACPGCHNPQTHDFAAFKREVSAQELMDMLVASPLNTGVTLSGGEPLCQAAQLLPFARAVKAKGVSLWIYSGYTFEQLMGAKPIPQEAAECIDLEDARALLSQCDVLVDGRFVDALKSYDAKWRGSTNQRVIDLPASLASGEAVLVEGTQGVPQRRFNRDRF